MCFGNIICKEVGCSEPTCSLHSVFYSCWSDARISNPRKGRSAYPKDELKAKLGSPSLLLLDVRSPVNWDSSSEKIVGAKRMEPDKVDVWVEAVPKDKETILYCA